MARALSAIQRESYALSRIILAGQRRALSHLTHLGKGDTSRGLCVAAALVLTTAGVLAPHLPAATLAALLFLPGAALALLASSASFEAPRADAEPDRTSPEPALARPRTLGELLAKAESRPISDLATWSRLTHRMSHELRTPLNSVIGFSELMSAEVFGPLGSAQYADYARNINKSGRILLKSAEDALAITNLLTRSDARSRDAVANVKSGVEDALVFAAPDLANLGLKLRFDICDRIDVIGEPQTLRQMLINLVSEALAYAEPDATLEIAAIGFGDDVALSIGLSAARIGEPCSEESFSMMLARTLAQLSGARLDCAASSNGWRVTAVFQRAAQADFFNLR